ncbi:uncharacterized protein LOC142796431 isoform X1 [Rhipicephalus microplus]|uniref:uncharacterized protein LOC142796431 isoform X1 n=1 Tax=Rhipicephalus microplus TaxID=6941 RepID=UPI003F6CFB6E
MVVDTIAHDSQRQEDRNMKERQNVRCEITGQGDLSCSDSSVIAHGAAYKDGRPNHRRSCAAPKSGLWNSQWAGHSRPLARGPCHRVGHHARANQCAASAPVMQPVGGGHWSIKLPCNNFTLDTEGAAPAQPTIAAVAAISAKAVGAKTAATAVTLTIETTPPAQMSQPPEPPAHLQQWPMQNYMQLVCRDKRAAAPPPHFQPRYKQSSTRLLEVITASAFYPTTSYWPQQQQLDDSYLVYRTAEQRVYPQLGPYASWRDMYPKVGCVPIRQITCADGDGHHDPSGQPNSGHPQDHLQSFMAYQHQEQQSAENWDLESYLPYQDAVPGTNGQGDGDAPAYGGGALAVAGDDDADVLREEQDEVVALLAEIDERHENHLAFERLLQEREPNFWRHRWRPPAQFPSQHFLLPPQFISAPVSYNSVDVFVDGGVWRSVSDHGLYDRSDQRLCPPLRVLQRQASSVFFQRFIADDITLSRATRKTCSPPAPPSRTTSPNRDPVVVVTSAAPEQGSPEPTSAAADASAPSEGIKQEGVEQKCGEETGESKEGKASPIVVPRHTDTEAKEAACARPVTMNQQPPYAQRQETTNAIHQQRKIPNDYRRPTYPRREYYSTRRYNEHDHAMPPPSCLDRAPQAGRQGKMNDGGRYPPNAQCREGSNNRPILLNHNLHQHYSDGGGAYEKGKQQSARGGCHSASRNRNRTNNNNRQCNSTNSWNKDRMRQDVYPDVGNRGGFVGNRSSLPYCCRSVGGGGSRMSSPANVSAAATPPPSHRARRYNQKQGAGGGCGHQQQAQRQYSGTRPAPQQQSSTSRDMQSAGARPVAAVDNSSGGRHQSNKKANGDSSSRKPWRQQQQRADYNQPRCTNSRAAEPTPAKSPAPVSRPSCGSGPPGCNSGDSASAHCGEDEDDSSISLKMFWERTNFTICRRRSSQ